LAHQNALHECAYHSLQFITVTADNASNNSTLLDNLINNIKVTRDAAVTRSDHVLADKLNELDPERSMIRCLAHVIHLTVMALLVSLDAVSETDAMKAGDVDDFNLMTEDEAERVGVPDGAEGTVIVDDCDDEVDTGSVVAKVCKTKAARMSCD
jgi:hypothetical protein